MGNRSASLATCSSLRMRSEGLTRISSRRAFLNRPRYPTSSPMPVESMKLILEKSTRTCPRSSERARSSVWAKNWALSPSLITPSMFRRVNPLMWRFSTIMREPPGRGPLESRAKSSTARPRVRALPDGTGTGRESSRPPGRGGQGAVPACFLARLRHASGTGVRDELPEPVPLGPHDPHSLRRAHALGGLARRSAGDGDLADRTASLRLDSPRDRRPRLVSFLYHPRPVHPQAEVAFARSLKCRLAGGARFLLQFVQNENEGVRFCLGSRDAPTIEVDRGAGGRRLHPPPRICTPEHLSLRSEERRVGKECR